MKSLAIALLLGLTVSKTVPIGDDAAALAKEAGKKAEKIGAEEQAGALKEAGA